MAKSKAQMKKPHGARGARRVPPRAAQQGPPKLPAAVRGRDFPVVALGASAGGLDAFKKLLAALPADSGMAFILIQHLDPTHPSMMVELLAGHTAMKVLPASDATPVLPDHVYLIPPGADLSIRGGALRLSPPRERRGARMPFDFFLRSLAQERGARAICAILTGTGTDGSLGLKAVKESGGLVIVQDPKDAAFDGMPRSAIQTGAADLVLPLSKIPRAIVNFGRGVVVPGPDQQSNDPLDGAQARIVDLLRARTAHDFTLYKPGTLSRRIERRVAMAGAEGSARYLEMLRKDADELDLLAKDLLINVTSFFRDPETFAFLAKKVIPELLRAHPADRPLRVWVPACSTGEEAYSIAMIFLEEIAEAKRDTKLQVFASDASEEAVAFARQGTYPESIQADVPPARLARFFAKEDDGYRISRALREAVVCTTQDLLSDPPFSRIDFISCRNMLIYLRPEAQEKVISLFHFALRKDGILFLGAAETPGQLSSHFRAIAKRQRIYRHVGRSRPGEVEFPAASAEGARSRPARGAIPNAAAHVNLGEIAQRMLLEAYAPASVLVNHKSEGLYFFGATDRYLQVARGDATRDLIAMARGSLRTTLRAAIQRASREHAAVHLNGGRVDRDGVSVAASVSVQPVRAGDEELLLVSFMDQPERKAEAKAAIDPVADISRIAELEEDLDATRKELQGALRDLDVANEEHKAINEEAMSVNEEFQSTNEELETSKEELQSLNEELTALNNQLHEMNEQQRGATNDLQNILNSSDVTTILLDGKLNVRSFTPDATSLFGVLASDVGRPLADLARRSDDADLLRDARSVLANRAVASCEIKTDKGIWYIRRIRPYRTQDNRTEGVIVTFVDISERKAAEREIAAARAFSDSIVDTVRQPLVVLDDDLRVVSASRSFYRAFDLKAEDIVGRRLEAAGDGFLDVPALRDFLDRLRASQTEIEDHEIEINLPPLGRRFLVVTAREILGEQVAKRKILVAIEDITERKRTQDIVATAKLRAEQANLGKSRFLAAASHDLRQPLQTLSLLQGILAKKLKDQDSVKLLTRLDETLGAMSGMLNTLLDINQLEAGTVLPEMTDFPVDDLLQRLETEFRYHTEAAGLRWRVVNSGLNVRSDPRLLQQMLRNLLSNAVKYTKRGKILLGCRRQGDKLRIEVWDTGIGIPTGQFQAIFDEFHQLDNPARERGRGLGLGLSITQRLGILLNHPIDVRSRLGAGSVFTVVVPLGVKPGHGVRSLDGQPAASETARHTGAVLIVEDDPAVREMLELLFKAEGHRTATAPDGREALDLVAQGAVRPDVVICDYNLPAGLNGLETIMRLREALRRAIPAIVLTGDITTATLREVARQRCVHLSKPVKAEELTRLTRSLLATPPPAMADAKRESAEPGAQSPTVFVVDDDSAVLEAMLDLIKLQSRPVEVFATAEEFLTAYRRGRKGCLVVDARLPGMSGIELIERLKSEGHALPAIMITGYGDVPMAVEAMKVGAADFIEKPVRAEELVASIERVLQLTRDSSKPPAWREAALKRLAALTPREREVMDLVVAGHANKEIAARLDLSQRTIENHRAAVMKRTNVKSLPDLIRLVIAAA